jgi:hypothetical protein
MEIPSSGAWGRVTFPHLLGFSFLFCSVGMLIASAYFGLWQGGSGARGARVTRSQA